MKTQNELVAARRATIRLENGVKVRTCYWCDTSGKMTDDHVVPLGAGGSAGQENVVPACERCQSERCRLLCLHIEAKKLRDAAVKPRDPEQIVERFLCFVAAVKRQQHARERLGGLIERWVRLERERWGVSPTAGFDFSLPDVPEPGRVRWFTSRGLVTPDLLAAFGVG